MLEMRMKTKSTDTQPKVTEDNHQRRIDLLKLRLTKKWRDYQLMSVLQKWWYFMFQFSRKKINPDKNIFQIVIELSRLRKTALNLNIERTKKASRYW